MTTEISVMYGSEKVNSLATKDSQKHNFRFLKNDLKSSTCLYPILSLMFFMKKSRELF